MNVVVDSIQNKSLLYRIVYHRILTSWVKFCDLTVKLSEGQMISFCSYSLVGVLAKQHKQKHTHIYWTHSTKP